MSDNPEGMIHLQINHRPVPAEVSTFDSYAKVGGSRNDSLKSVLHFATAVMDQALRRTVHVGILLEFSEPSVFWRHDLADSSVRIHNYQLIDE